MRVRIKCQAHLRVPKGFHHDSRMHTLAEEIPHNVQRGAGFGERRSELARQVAELQINRARASAHATPCGFDRFHILARFVAEEPLKRSRSVATPR